MNKQNLVYKNATTVCVYWCKYSRFSRSKHTSTSRYKMSVLMRKLSEKSKLWIWIAFSSNKDNITIYLMNWLQLHTISLINNAAKMHTNQKKPRLITMIHTVRYQNWSTQSLCTKVKIHDNVPSYLNTSDHITNSVNLWALSYFISTCLLHDLTNEFFFFWKTKQRIRVYRKTY